MDGVKEVNDAVLTLLKEKSRLEALLRERRHLRPLTNRTEKYLTIVQHSGSQYSLVGARLIPWIEQRWAALFIWRLRAMSYILKLTFGIIDRRSEHRRIWIRLVDIPKILWKPIFLYGSTKGWAHSTRFAEVLNLAGCEHLTDGNFQFLAHGSGSLLYLNISDTKISPNSIKFAFSAFRCSQEKEEQIEGSLTETRENEESVIGRVWVYVYTKYYTT